MSWNEALGILNPMVIEDLNKEIQEEHTDPELIREALKEAVFKPKNQLELYQRGSS